MLNLFLSPKGKISSSQMMMGGMILIILGLIMNLAPIVKAMSSFGSLLLWLGFVFIVPWIFLWMKRYRDGGQHPAMCLIPLITFPVIFLIIFVAMNWGLITEAFSASLASGGDQAATNDAMREAMTEGRLNMMTWSVVAGPTLAALITLFGFNALIKAKPPHSMDPSPSSVT